MANKLNLDHTEFVEAAESGSDVFSSDELSNIEAFNVGRTLSNDTVQEIQSVLDSNPGGLSVNVPGIPANKTSPPIAIAPSLLQSKGTEYVHRSSVSWAD